jgi:hypothetical protein
MLSNAHRYVQPADEAERIYLESLIREDFMLCHPGETLEDVKRRAAFSKEDKGLLRDWMALAACRAAADRANLPSLQPHALPVRGLDLIPEIASSRDGMLRGLYHDRRSDAYVSQEQAASGRSLQSRLLVLWLMLVVSGATTRYLLFESFRPTSNARVARSEDLVARACRDIADRYQFFVTGWGGGSVDDRLKQELAAVNRSLNFMCLYRIA